jgi:hypothetical protein
LIACSCGLQYTVAAFRALPLVGYSHDGPHGDLEHRNCPCGSTRCLRVVRFTVRRSVYRRTRAAVQADRGAVRYLPGGIYP